MFLCVDRNFMSILPNVQKDVNLEWLINNHTKYFDNVEQAYEENYVPLDFCVSVRSLYSNKVLEIDKEIEGEERKLYYTNLTQVQQFPHKGYDLIMYLTSIGLMHSVEYKLGFDELMMKHSQFSPIGLYNPDPLIINPIIYTHILISDEGVEELEKYLKDGRRFVHINDMKRSYNLDGLLDTLVIVKEKEDNE